MVSELVIVHNHSFLCLPSIYKRRDQWYVFVSNDAPGVHENDDLHVLRSLAHQSTYIQVIDSLLNETQSKNLE